MDRVFRTLALGGAAALTLTAAGCDKSPVNAGTSQLCAAENVERTLAVTVRDSINVSDFANGVSEGGMWQTPATSEQVALRTISCTNDELEEAFRNGNNGFGGRWQILNALRLHDPVEAQRFANEQDRLRQEALDRFNHPETKE